MRAVWCGVALVLLSVPSCTCFEPVSEGTSAGLDGSVRDGGLRDAGSSPDAGAEFDAGRDAGRDASSPDAGQLFTCADAGFTDLVDTACATSSDCTTVMHRIDCCGTELAVGVASRGAAYAAAVEQQCIGPAMCDCAAQATHTEDGLNLGAGGTVAVTCQAGRCQSSFLMGHAACQQDSECSASSKCCYPCGIPGCQNVCTSQLMNGQCPMVP